MSKAPRLVLIADDEPTIGQLLDRIMRPLGIATIVVDNGADAIAAARQHAAELSAAFIDIQMPRINGLVVAQDIHQHLPQLPIVLMSAGIPPNLAANAALPALAGFLQKPFSLDTVRMLLAQLGLAGAPPSTP